MIRCGNWEAELELKTVLSCPSWAHGWMVLSFTVIKGRASISFRVGYVGLDNTF